MMGFRKTFHMSGSNVSFVATIKGKTRIISVSILFITV